VGGSREDLPLKALKQTSALAGVLALAFASRRYKDAPALIAKALGDRLAEVLPPDEYIVEVNGPGLSVRDMRGSSSSGLPGMQLLERGTSEEKLTRVFMEEATSLRNMIIGARRQGPPEDPVHGARLPGAFFDPHVEVTDTAIEIWWGGADPDRALVRLRSIPRAEIGL
jgi:hypothetical protein